ncbi:hypothetical protein MHYP_G00257440 [Metynnis hypsauchen]
MGRRTGAELKLQEQRTPTAEPKENYLQLRENRGEPHLPQLALQPVKRHRGHFYGKVSRRAAGMYSAGKRRLSSVRGKRAGGAVRAHRCPLSRRVQRV